MRPLSKIFAIVVVGTVAACGGSSESAPGPLSRHFDDMHIAQIPLEQKQSVVKTQNDWSVAKMENAKAEADFNDITSQLTVVRNEERSAKIAIDSAISNKKSAEASADTNRMNAAQKDLRTAELVHKAAQARVKYYEQVRSYLGRLKTYTAANMYWRESQYEVAKSTLGQQSGKAPKDVKYEWFPSQESERSKRVSKEKERTESEKSKAQRARETWQTAQAVADQASGKMSSYPDPMAAPGPATTLGTTTP